MSGGVFAGRGRGHFGGLLLILFFIPVFFAGAGAVAEVAVPPLRGPVTDLTGTLTPQQTATLERSLGDFEQRKGSQIAVLVVPGTQPETIEQYSIRVAEAWKLGRKGVDDGVLLLVAIEDRELRIEVGYGLEGAIPDAVANRVVEDVMVPYFKRGDYYGGIDAGVAQVMRLIDGEKLPEPARRDASWQGMEGFLPLLLFGVVLAGAALRTLFGRLLGAAVAGGIAGAVVWFLFGSLLFGILAGIFAMIFTLGGGGGWGYPGGRGGWGGGSGGGFGGGFRGGGGGFGGGGASGRW